MFKHRVTYNDFNDVEHTEDIYFHLMAPELADLQFNPDMGGDLGTFIKSAMASGEGQKIYTIFKLLMHHSYGRRSEDGSEFIKRSEFTEKFFSSRAYEEFFMWLLENPKNAEAFWNGIMPERIINKAEAMEAAGKKRLQDMSKEELVLLFQQQLAEKKPANEIES